MKNEKTLFSRLPNEMLIEILKHLNITNLTNARAVNKDWNTMIDSDAYLKLPNLIRKLQQIISPVYRAIENTAFENSQKGDLEFLIERDLYQQLLSLFKNKSQEQQEAAFQNFKKKIEKDNKDSPYTFFDKIPQHISSINFTPKDILLLHCIKFNFINMVKKLMKETDVKLTTGDYYPIRWAAQKGQLEVVQCLLEDTQLDPILGKNHAFKTSAEYGQIDIVRHFIQDKQIDSAAHKYALNNASRNGHTKTVKALLEHLLIIHPEWTIETLQENCIDRNAVKDITKEQAFIDALSDIRSKQGTRGRLKLST